MDAGPALETGFAEPPPEARLRAMWWWLNGNVTKAAITRDLQEMKAKGFGGIVLIDADGSGRNGNVRVPGGPTFLSPAWRELYRHALDEARRLELEVSLSPQSGYNLGGPMVPAEDAPKKLVWADTGAQGGESTIRLPRPGLPEAWYRDLFVLAYRVIEDAVPAPPIRNLTDKTVVTIVRQSAPDTAEIVLDDVPSREGEAEVRSHEVIDLTAAFNPGDDTVRANLPGGFWRILRFGCTTADRSRVSMASQGWEGHAIDVLDEGALRRYWQAAVAPLLDEAGTHVGTTLKYLMTDSWEVDNINWTLSLPGEFRRRRGYDLLPYLPAFNGKIVDSREVTNRVLEDFRRTIGELAADHHYRPLAALARARGLRIHPEAGGPHAVPIDAQHCLGLADVPMGEFWARGSVRRFDDKNRFFVKQPASAAHVHGRRYVAGEGFTTIGRHWQETLWDNLKPAFDRAACEGLNRVFWHAFVCSPDEMGLPGQQYFAGTHLNPLVTWWEHSAPFFRYLNRVQFMLQQGRPVADVLYYYGDHVPNFAQLRDADPARLGRGYDYDVIDAAALLGRVGVRDGRLVLPDGMSYSLLVLPPNQPAMSLPVLRRLRELQMAGARLAGPPPRRTGGWLDFERRDAELRELVGEMWRPGAPGSVRDATGRDALAALGIDPDFTAEGTGGRTLDYIHRRTEDADIYFVSNRTGEAVTAQCGFRVTGRAPELWDAVTGAHRLAAAYDLEPERTVVPLEFEPYGSWFVVFRAPAERHPASGSSNARSATEVVRVEGGWTVEFDRARGGPGEVEFTQLEDWTRRPEPGIRHYSGTAVYRKKVTVPAGLVDDGSLALDLGRVREIAEVSWNGRKLGTVWAPPFRVGLAGALRAGENELVIKVVNFWPNRLVGDASLPESSRVTRTNIREVDALTPLMPSGLLGPVRLLSFP